MEWFRTYHSNTLGGTGNQQYFHAGEPMTGRSYYRVFASGTCRYSLLFGGAIDSTYRSEYESYANLPLFREFLRKNLA